MCRPGKHLPNYYIHACCMWELGVEKVGDGGGGGGGKVIDQWTDVTYVGFSQSLFTCLSSDRLGFPLM